ncbi:MAG TPA: FAD-dependent oxidoreductase [Chthoniobacteraceae bacterium]|nr:FAD-dependent oxidoreductase [Chthoniobacteraceae bacterium]
MKHLLHEPARETPVAEETDVVVCGAGPAGVAAAIAAARGGARTRLLEVHGCLGGIWTAGLLTYVIDADKPTGLLPEIVARLKARSAYRQRSGANFVYDPEQMKLVLEAMCQEEGVAIQLHTRVVAAAKSPSGRLESVVTESKTGRQAWKASVFIDATGDGDLGALAGVRYDVGRGESGETQPMSLMALVAGLDPEAMDRFHRPANRSRREEFLAEFHRANHFPSYTAPSLFYIRDDLFALMANHVYAVSHADAQAITDATLRARREIDDGVRALRSLGGVWANLRLISTAAQIGVREGRRLHGRDAVTVGDLVAGRLREDGVCRARFGMDVHSPNPDASRAFDFSQRQPVRPYDIPYGALVAAGVDALLMAGRCISGDFLAHSSYRVTGNAVPMGEAAGKAAAYCALAGLLPCELEWPSTKLAAPVG